jgi:hypothetical protein
MRFHLFEFAMGLFLGALITLAAIYELQSRKYHNCLWIELRAKKSWKSTKIKCSLKMTEMLTSPEKK